MSSPCDEDALIARVPRQPVPGSGVRVGIGDDGCVLARSGAEPLVISVDSAVDGVHFRLDECGMEAAARKAVRAALSDLAAMGGAERGFLLAAVTLDRRRPPREREEALRALAEEAVRWGFELAGGNIASADGPTTLSITVGAWMENPIRRDGARPGDVLLVTGELGGSLRGRHLTFHPRLAEARELCDTVPVRALMDLSDGLGRDLPRLARASGVRAVVQAERLPASPAARELAAGDEAQLLRHVLGDGEDYELLLAVRPEDAPRIPPRLATGAPVTAIGRVEAGEGCVLEEKGRSLPWRTMGWDHLGGPSQE